MPRDSANADFVEEEKERGDPEKYCRPKPNGLVDSWR